MTNALHSKSRTKRQEIRLALFNKYNQRCFYCHKLLTLDSMTLDHRIPRAKIKEQQLFSNELQDNLVPTCQGCNKRKGSMTEQEFRRAYGYNLRRQ